jgi:hypothetical protein
VPSFEQALLPRARRVPIHIRQVLHVSTKLQKNPTVRSATGNTLRLIVPLLSTNVEPENIE